jgi:hypothetical protein
MKTSTLSILPALVVCQLALAQKICFRDNESAAVSYTRGASMWGIQLTATQALTLTGLEFKLSATADTTVQFTVYDQDFSTLGPGFQIGGGFASLDGGVPGWYSATIRTDPNNPASPPTQIPAGATFFVGYNLVAGVLPATGNAGNLVTHWTGSALSWNGPFQVFSLPYRVHCSLHQGAFATYGAGKAGSGGAVPALRGIGFPNTGNPLRLQTTDVLGGAAGVLLLGVRIDTMAPPLGTFYAAPLVGLSITAAGSGAGTGFSQVDLTVPLDPTLNGALVAFQSWFLDAGASASFAHSQGLEATIGH